MTVITGTVCWVPCLFTPKSNKLIPDIAEQCDRKFSGFWKRIVRVASGDADDVMLQLDGVLNGVQSSGEELILNNNTVRLVGLVVGLPGALVVVEVALLATCLSKSLTQNQTALFARPLEKKSNAWALLTTPSVSGLSVVRRARNQIESTAID